MTEKDIKKQMTDRFIRYTKFDTMSDPELCGVKRPTTDGQSAMLGGGFDGCFHAQFYISF